MWAIDEILWLLKDGKWHDIGDIEKECSLKEYKVEMILSFLSEHGFIEVDKKGRKARLQSSVCEFINEIQRVEEEEAIRA